MTTGTDTPPGAPCAADVDAAIRALQARMRETTAQAFYCRPLQRRTVATLLMLATHYQALTRQEE